MRTRSGSCWAAAVEEPRPCPLDVRDARYADLRERRGDLEEVSHEAFHRCVLGWRRPRGCQFDRGCHGQFVPWDDHPARSDVCRGHRDRHRVQLLRWRPVQGRYLPWRPPRRDRIAVHRRARRPDGPGHEGRRPRQPALRRRWVHWPGLCLQRSDGRRYRTLQFANPADGPTIINDVIVAGGAAWFTDSAQPNLYRVPFGANGSVGASTTLVVSGPAAHLSGAFNMNGIDATPDGKTLFVAHSGDGTIYRVDPGTGVSLPIAGADVPNVDGILFEADRMWAVQNFSNQVTALRLSPDLSSATVEGVITSPHFEIPTTVARDGSRLAVVNAKFDTGFPPTATSFEVVVVDGR